MTRVVVAPDKFRGSLTASQVADHVAAGLCRARPRLEVTRIPVADGGEGTLEAALAAGYRRLEATVSGPVGEPVRTAVAVLDTTAVVELATASGLALLGPDDRDPLRATSLGTGQLIRAALDAGCDTIVIGVGGSACTDGGAGLLAGLGARLLDQAGDCLPPGGAALTRLARLDLSGLDPRLAGTQVVLATDVDNPLLGPRGAAAVYGPQKGADEADVRLLEQGLARWAQLLEQALGPAAQAAASAPGAGAAGGTGFAAIAALGAVRRSGIDVVLELVGFADRLPGAALVVTGEGSLDEQSLYGKAPVGVAAAARAAGAPVVAVCGRRLLDDQRLRSAGFAAGYALTDLEPDVATCIAQAGPLLERVAESRVADHLPDVA